MTMLTIEGIETAIENLGVIKETSPRYRLLKAIWRLYEHQENIEEITPPDPEELIKAVWQVDGDKQGLRRKIRNLNSLRSALNSEFMRLYRRGRNPEGIVIGPQFLFVMSDEAKDNILEQIGGQIGSGSKLNLSQITEVLKLINQALSDKDLQDSEEEELEKLKGLIEGLTKKLGAGVGKGESEDGDLDAEDGRQLEADEVEIVHELLEEEDPLEEPEELLEEVLDQDENPEDGYGTSKGVGQDEGQGGQGPSNEAQTEGQVKGVAGEIKGEKSYEGLEFGKEGRGTNLLEEVMDKGGDAGQMAGKGGQGEMGEDGGEALQDIQKREEEILEEDTEIESGEQSEELELAEDEEGVIDANILTEEEIQDDEPPLDIEEILEDPESLETGVAEINEHSPLGLGEGLGQETEYDDPHERARLLAEAFDGYLGAMDRYYNQYLLIPGGEYKVGSPSNMEYKEHLVSLAPFYLGKFPVTNALFEIFVEKTGYITTAEKVGHGIVYQGRYRQKVDPKTGKRTFVWNSGIRRKRVEGACWYQPTGPGSNLHGKRNHPVVQVSLEDAMAFAAWTGKRLPTEAEWEAGARTRKGFPFPWGEVWVDEASNVESSLVADTTPVDKYKEFANELKIVDCLGNVMEWTQSAVGESYLVKGGGWLAKRGTPLWSRAIVDPSYHSNVLGFRCVAY